MSYNILRSSRFYFIFFNLKYQELFKIVKAHEQKKKEVFKIYVNHSSSRLQNKQKMFYNTNK